MWLLLLMVNTSDYLGPVDIVGCMDANATMQQYDQWGNLQCVYASCDVNTSDYSGPYGVDIVGCMDANATNYNAAATEQEGNTYIKYDQWGNLQCVYASCDDIPEFGCIYPDYSGFGAFNMTNGFTCCSMFIIWWNTL